MAEGEGFEPNSSAITLWAKPNRVIKVNRGFELDHSMYGPV